MAVHELKIFMKSCHFKENVDAIIHKICNLFQSFPIEFSSDLEVQNQRLWSTNKWLHIKIFALWKGIPKFRIDLGESDSSRRHTANCRVEATKRSLCVYSLSHEHSKNNFTAVRLLRHTVPPAAAAACWVSYMNYKIYLGKGANNSFWV